MHDCSNFQISLHPKILCKLPLQSVSKNRITDIQCAEKRKKVTCGGKISPNYPKLLTIFGNVTSKDLESGGKPLVEI